MVVVNAGLAVTAITSPLIAALVVQLMFHRVRRCRPHWYYATGPRRAVVRATVVRPIQSPRPAASSRAAAAVPRVIRGEVEPPATPDTMVS
jgi:hypothetical protein